MAQEAVYRDRVGGKLTAWLIERLVAFVTHELALDKRDANGCTERENLEAEWRQRGYRDEHMPHGLQPVDCPEEVKYLWGYFLNLNRRRTASGFGLGPIGHADVEAWMRLRGFELMPFEMDAILAIEYAWIAFQQAPPAEINSKDDD